MKDSEYADWENVRFEITPSNRLSDATDFVAGIRLLGVSAASMNNVNFLTNAHVTASTVYGGGAYFGVWWDSMTLSSLFLRSVTIQAAGVTHSNDHAFSASVYWSDVEFSNANVSNLVIQTTSPVITDAVVAGGISAGVYFFNTIYDDSQMENVIISSSGVNASDTTKGFGFRSENEASSNTQFKAWTVEVSGDCHCSNGCVGLEWLQTMSSDVTFLDYDVVLDSTVTGYNAQGVVFNNWQDSASKFRHFQILVNDDVIGEYWAKGVYLYQLTWEEEMVNNFLVKLSAKVAAPNNGNQNPYLYTFAKGIDLVCFLFRIFLFFIFIFDF